MTFKNEVLPTTGEKHPMISMVSSESYFIKAKFIFQIGILHRIALQAIPIAIDQVIADRFTIIYVNSTRDVLHQLSNQTWHTITK
jgi:hypothetical protein